MLFLISPAKTLDFEAPALCEQATLPAFLDRSAELVGLLRDKSAGELAALMQISAPLAQLNHARFQDWQPEMLPAVAKQAVLAFMGDVYEGLAASSLNGLQLAYLQQNLRILSGLYGLLRPLDLIRPYRLEMGTRLLNPYGRDLYQFWGDSLTRALNQQLQGDTLPVVVNLASEEYFKAIKTKQLQGRLLECVFEDWKVDRYKIISFYAKRARGMMVRFAALNQITQVDDLKQFNFDGYDYVKAASSEDRWVFRRNVSN